MKRWKRIIAGMLSLVFFMTSVRISFLEKAHAQGTERTIVSRVVTGENGKSYVEVDGKPFMYENVECMGTWQLRGFDKNSVTGYEDPLPMEWLENVFEKTAYAGYNTVSTFFSWSDIEPKTKGGYDWTLLDKYLAWADKYDLHLSLTWFGSDAGGGTRLPGYGAGWSCHVPEYLCDRETYWNGRPMTEEQLEEAKTKESRFRAPRTGEVADYIRTCERNALIALTEHLRDTDTTHRMISLMINNESQNIPDSWHSDLAHAVKSVGYDFVIGQHQQRSQYRALEGYDFVGFDDYSTDLNHKLSFLNNSPTPLKACLETGGNANNLSSQVLSGITNGGWVQAWQLNDAYSDCQQLGMFETPNADYNAGKPDYLTWQLGTLPKLKYGAEKNKRLQLALRKAYWVVAQASEKEMVSFNLETDEPVSGYQAEKNLNGHMFGFESDGPDTRGKGSNGMIANRQKEYFCLSDTGTSVTFLMDAAPLSASYGYQDENGAWVSEQTAEVVQRDSDTWAVSCGPQQVLRLELEDINKEPVFEQNAYTKTTIKNSQVNGTVSASDANYWDTVTYSISQAPRNGTAQVSPDSGAWTYTPNHDYYGEDSFVITASDGNGGSSTATVRITVKENNSAPVFVQSVLTMEICKNTVAGGRLDFG